MDIDPFDVAAMGQRNNQAKQLNELTKELRRQKDEERRAPKCPVCGGALPGEYRKCKHCQADLSWVEGRVCEPGEEQDLRDTIAAEKEKKERAFKEYDSPAAKRKRGLQKKQQRMKKAQDPIHRALIKSDKEWMYWVGLIVSPLVITGIGLLLIFSGAFERQNSTKPRSLVLSKDPNQIEFTLGDMREDKKSPPPAKKKALVESKEPNYLDDNPKIIQITGKNIAISLLWTGRNDLDLNVKTPSGTIWHGNRTLPDGGQLDITANNGGQFAKQPIENVFWPNDAPEGKYKVSVVYSGQYGQTTNTPFRLMIRINKNDGTTKVESTRGQIESVGQAVVVTEFSLKHD